MRVIVILALSLFSAMTIASWQPLSMQGKVVSEQNQPLSAVDILVGGITVTTDDLGKFNVALTGKDRYQVSLSAKGFYNKVHNFSHQELITQKNLEFTLVARKAGRVMMAFGGDVMMGRRYYSPYFDDPVLINENAILSDSKEILRHIKPYLTIADFAAVNLESQVAESKPSQRAPKGVTFYSRPETVDALQWAGIDYVTLGNNHTYDYLDEGLISTLATLDEKGLNYSGAGVTEEDALKPYIYNTDKVDYAMLGYVGWQGSKAIKQAANSEQGGAAFGTMQNIVDAVKQANTKEQVAIVQYHGSLEYSNEPTGVTEQRLKSGLDAGAAMAIAHHPHVAQGLELYNDKLIAYSMGNFVFDQNFSSTQLSLLLYVWLDEGKFHRAEIVPVYVKGYKPTPALGVERDVLLKRLIALSNKRNTTIVSEAGHGVITKELTDNAKETKVSVLANTHKTHLISTAKAGMQITKVELPKEISNYRLGTNLINGSDFEQFTSFHTKERGIAFDSRLGNIGAPGFESNQALALTVNKARPTSLSMKHFRRVYRPDNPVTFKADIKAKQGVKFNLYWQGRKTRQKLFDAFENSPKHLIKSVEFSASDDWQQLEIDFNAPRIGFRSYRIMAELESKVEVQEVLIDNFSLIQWHTAYQNNIKPMLTDDGGYMADFIGLSNTSSQPIELTLK